MAYPANLLRFLLVRKGQSGRSSIARIERAHSDRARSASRRTTRLARRLPSAVLIPCVALFDGPEDGFFELLEDHIVGLVNGLQFLV